jgi:hypothetical protein
MTHADLLVHLERFVVHRIVRHTGLLAQDKLLHLNIGDALERAGHRSGLSGYAKR